MKESELRKFGQESLVEDLPHDTGNLPHDTESSPPEPKSGKFGQESPVGMVISDTPPFSETLTVNCGYAIT